VNFSNHPLSNNQLPIGLNKLKPIANCQLIVDDMLTQYAELIVPGWHKWFAKQFQTIEPDMLARCASEAKEATKWYLTRDDASA
jgi:hypothetical protein